MSLSIWIEKYRPQVFEEVIAQEHISKTLQNAIKIGRVAHAYLFTGPRGIGKTTSARLLAKALNCKEGPTPTPCNTCNFCVSITEGNSPDVLEIDGASNRGIEEVRSLQEKIQYAPQSRYRVIIIDEVHMLTKEAFNALLKTLEEPPPYIIFVLATTEPNKIPETIRSRCQRFDFKRISINDIARVVKDIAIKEQFTIDDAAASVIAARAEGGLRDALSMLDQLLAFAESKTIDTSLVYEVLGLVPIESFIKMAQAIADKEPNTAMRILGELIENGKELNAITQSFIENFHKILLIKLHIAPPLVQQAEEKFRELAELFSKEDLLRIVNLLASLPQEMRYALRPRYLLEERIIKLCLLDSVVSLKKLIGSKSDIKEEKARVGIKTETKLFGGKTSQQPPFPVSTRVRVKSPSDSGTSTSTPVPPKEEVTPKKQKETPLVPRDKDTLFLETVESERGSGFVESLRHSKRILREQKLFILFSPEYEFIANKLANPNSLKYLEKTAKKIWGEDIKIGLRLEEAGDEKEPKLVTKQEPKSTDTKELPKGVAQIIDLFGGKVIE